MTKATLTMKLLKENFGVCRLDKDAKIPEWAYKGAFFSLTKTDDELSIVCDQASIPKEVVSELNWRMLKVMGPLDFSLIGILASISKTLADSGISIFAISTYDTDYILLKADYLEAGLKALEGNGYTIVKA